MQCKRLAALIGLLLTCKKLNKIRCLHAVYKYMELINKKKLFKAFPMFAVMQNWEHEAHGLRVICGWLQANYNILDSWSKISHNVNQFYCK